jgi:hypothetical protein
MGVPIPHHAAFSIWTTRQALFQKGLMNRTVFVFQLRSFVQPIFGERNDLTEGKLFVKQKGLHEFFNQDFIGIIPLGSVTLKVLSQLHELLSHESGG